ncbi:MAG: dihydrolipoamide acetyltransferase family protein [Nocardioidaceae bacterium]
MTVHEFKLPDVGEGLTEAEIVTWMVKPGDTIKINDVVCEIETAKSLVELPSPYAGTVGSLLVPEGQTVPVGTPIISISSGEHSGDGVAAAAAPAADDASADEAVEQGMAGSPAPAAEGRTPTLVGYGPRTTEAKRRPRKGATPADTGGVVAQQEVQTAFTPGGVPAALPDPTEPAVPTTPGEPVRTPAGAGRVTVLAKPPVRKLAKDLGIDLADVSATGPGGTITRADVEAHDSTAAPSATPAEVGAFLPGAAETRVPVKGVRKMTAQAMVSSAFTAPHVTEWVTLDATRTMKLVARLREARAFTGVKVSPLLVVARAICLAVRRTPEVNSVWDESTQEIVLKHYVNLGIAAATPRGLVVPNVKGADAMSALDLARSIGELTTVAREGRTQPAQMSGGTFTITNVGVFGVDSGTPIINPGESAILAMGAIRKQPWVVNNKVKARWVTTLALSFDHRVVDGEQGSRFLADVAAVVEDPAHALLL